jgi:hypothetical protein
MGLERFRKNIFKKVVSANPRDRLPVFLQAYKASTYKITLMMPAILVWKVASYICPVTWVNPDLF